jgi:hypothetical protein
MKARLLGRQNAITRCPAHRNKGLAVHVWEGKMNSRAFLESFAAPRFIGFPPIPQEKANGLMG